MILLYIELGLKRFLNSTMHRQGDKILSYAWKSLKLHILWGLRTKKTETERKTFVTLLEHCTLCSSWVSIRKCLLFSTLQGGFQNNPAEKNLYALPREKQAINNGLQSFLKEYFNYVCFKEIILNHLLNLMIPYWKLSWKWKKYFVKQFFQRWHSTWCCC